MTKSTLVLFVGKCNKQCWNSYIVYKIKNDICKSVFFIFSFILYFSWCIFPKQIFLYFGRDDRIVFKGSLFLLVGERSSYFSRPFIKLQINSPRLVYSWMKKILDLCLQVTILTPMNDIYKSHCFSNLGCLLL